MTRTARAVSVGLAMLVAPQALAQSCAPPSSQYEETFDGGFETFWDTFTFANDPLYLGFPSHNFTSVGGEDVIQLTPALGSGQYVGMNPANYCFSSDVQFVEMRFRVQDINAGGLLALRIVSPSGRFFEVGVGGFDSAEIPRFYCDHWNLPEPLTGNFELLPDTWYSMRILKHPFRTLFFLYDEHGNKVNGVGCSTVWDFEHLEEFGFGIYPQIRVWLDDTNIPTTPVFAVDYVRVSTEVCLADLASPYFELDFNDVVAFLEAFSMMEPAADFAPPMGVWDFSDIGAFLAAFGAGCP